MHIRRRDGRQDRVGGAALHALSLCRAPEATPACVRRWLSLRPVTGGASGSGDDQRRISRTITVLVFRGVSESGYGVAISPQPETADCVQRLFRHVISEIMTDLTQ